MSFSAKKLLKTIIYGFSALIIMISAAPTCVFASEEPTLEISAVALADYSCEIFGTAQGLPTGISSACQDADGYMLFGGADGLFCFGGTEFVKISDEAVTSLANGEDRIWAGTSDGLLYLSDNKICDYEPQDIILGAVNSLCETKDGILASCSNGLYFIGKDANKCETVCGFNGQIVSACADLNGIIWFIGADGCVYTASNGNAVKVDVESKGFSSIFLADDGRLFFGGTSNAIFCLEARDDGSFDMSEISANGCTVNGFCREKSGRIWVLTDKGIGFLRDDSFVFAKTEISGEALFACVDKEGNPWFCSESEGVLHIARSRFVNIGEAAGIYGISAGAAEIYDNLLYIATARGLVIYDGLGGGKLIENELSGLLGEIKINALHEDENGALLISTDDKYGIVKYNADGSGGWTLFNSENGIGGKRINDATGLQNGSFAAATENGVSVVANDGSISNIGGTGEIFALCNADDKLFACGENGVFSIENGSAVSLYSESPVRRLYYSYTNGLIFTADGALMTLRNGTVEALCDRNALGFTVYDIFEANDKLLLSTSSGIVKTDFSSLCNGKFTAIYGAESGLCSSVTEWSGLCATNGVLYICCTNGVFALDTSFMSPSPVVLVDAVFADNTELHADKSIVLDGKCEKLTIKTALLTYGEKPAVFAQLSGIDSEPVLITGNTISYNKLKGGEYEFRLWAVNSDGVESDIIKIEFDKQKQWYESALFWIILIIAFVVAVFLVSAFYIFTSIRKNEELQIQKVNFITQAMIAVADTIDSKTNVSAGHSSRVAQYSVEIAQRLKLGDEFSEKLYSAALLHDIGNVSISDEILKKPHKLEPEELAAVKKHSELGSEILREHEALRSLSDAVRYHHERYDGLGYSSGLNGTGIPISSRIIFAAEALDAMNTEKPYRPKLVRERIINEFRVGSGTQFDPEIAETVIKMIESGFRPE